MADRPRSIHGSARATTACRTLDAIFTLAADPFRKTQPLTRGPAGGCQPAHTLLDCVRASRRISSSWAFFYIQSEKGAATLPNALRTPSFPSPQRRAAGRAVFVRGETPP